MENEKHIFKKKNNKHKQATMKMREKLKLTARNMKKMKNCNII